MDSPRTDSLIRLQRLMVNVTNIREISAANFYTLVVHEIYRANHPFHHLHD